ncbi:MAG TPA: ABC transporter ATP-binding protein [Acidimicrobiia bacterium]
MDQDAAPLDEPDAASALRRGARVLSRYIRTHPGPFSLAVLGSTVFASMAVAGTIVVGHITDKVFTPAVTSHHASSGTVWWFAAVVVIIAALRSAGVMARRYFAALTTRRMQVTLRTQINEQYLRVPLSWHRATPTGELIAHADTDVDVAVEVLNPLPFSVGLSMLVIFSVIALILADPILAVVGFTVFPGLAVLNQYYTRRVEAPAERVQERVSDVSTIAHESYDGALLVKTLGLEAHEVERLAAASERLRESRMEVGRLRSTFEPSLDALPNLAVIAILAIGGWRVSRGALTAGELVEVMLLFSLLSFPMRVVGFLLEEMPRSSVALGRIDGVLVAEHEREPSEPRSLPDGALRVEIDNLVFAYVDDERVLDGCNLTVEPGEVVAIVGATGSGKSTLCELLAGLIEPTAGSIKLGGVEIDHIEPEALHRSVGLVFQEAFLFGGTLAENLTLGQVDSQAAADAVRVAQARRFIANLTHGYDTVIGERGVTLSGGQRQRTALARALARRPQLLILDDATSAVDPTVEARILDGLTKELTTTTLIVAHRLSTIALADRVAFLRDGRIIATGPHLELIATHADYAAMVQAYEQAGALSDIERDDDADEVDQADEVDGAGEAVLDGH